MRGLLRSPWRRLVMSHLIVVGMGVVAGVIYARSQRPSIQTMVEAVERATHLEAAMLAYRFGSADHARFLLEGCLRKPPMSQLGWGDVMMTRARLAVLDGEHTRHSEPAPQLAAAADACVRFGGPGCSVEQLRVLAGQLAAVRGK